MSQVIAYCLFPMLNAEENRPQFIKGNSIVTRAVWNGTKLWMCIDGISGQLGLGLT
jgi:hypothetical protein